MNKYQILGVIGEGAYGVVLKCRNRLNDNIVAIKKFKETDEDELVRKTTLRELRILKQLHQENIVSLIDAFRRKRKLYLVFEYVEQNMLELLDEEPNGLSSYDVRTYTYQLLKALEYCHQFNIIHRDIKPENLLISDNKVLKLCDFGFARNIFPKKQVNITRYVATRWYRAPELLVGSTTYGKPVDVWAVGCIMGEMFTGSPVFPGDSDIDQLYIIQKTIGPLTDEQIQLFHESPNFAGLKFPEDVKHSLGVETRYGNEIPGLALELMVSILKMDERNRPTASQLLEHHFFDPVRNRVTPSLLRPNTSQNSSGGGSEHLNKKKTRFPEIGRPFSPEHQSWDQTHGKSTQYLPIIGSLKSS